MYLDWLFASDAEIYILHIECSKQFKWNLYFYVPGQSWPFWAVLKLLWNFKFKKANTFISLKSERNNPWFEPWFNILLHTQSTVCTTVKVNRLDFCFIESLYNTDNQRNLNFCPNSAWLLRKLDRVVLWILSNDTRLLQRSLCTELRKFQWLAMFCLYTLPLHRPAQA